MGTIADFKRELWAGRLEANLKKNLVFSNVVNTNYQGTVAYGESVRILGITQPTIDDYSGTLDAAESVAGDFLKMTIDQAKYFHFYADDVLMRQANGGNLGVVDECMNEASYGIADAVDQYIAGLVVGATNKIGTTTVPIEIDADNAYDYLIDVETALKESNANGERFVVVPHFYTAALNKQIFVKDPAIALPGYLGNVGTLKIYESNNVFVDTNDSYNVMAGVRQAVTFAGQIDEMEMYRPELRFANAVKGLYTFGAKVTKPAGLVNLFCVKAS